MFIQGKKHVTKRNEWKDYEKKKKSIYESTYTDFDYTMALSKH